MKNINKDINKRIRLFAIILAAFLVLFTSNVHAKDITLSLNQSEYYFIAGEQAVIPLAIDNSYGKDISGMLSYTITQQINQGNFQYQSSNTQSKSFNAPNGKNTLSLNFGSSDSPMDLKVQLSFNYNDKDDRVVSLPEILIHFVANQNQQQSNQQKIKSSSQSAAQQQQQAQQQQNNIQQQIQQMQQQMNNMFGNGQQDQQNQQNSQQKVQNNQISQDSNAVKQQMENQLKQQQEMKQEFEKNIAQNHDFQKMNHVMIRQGYNITSANLDPENNNTGNFEVNYQKNGESAQLKGRMENGNITNIEKRSSEDDKSAIDKLMQDEKFRRYNTELIHDKFLQQNIQLEKEGNVTHVSVPYTNNMNKTALITADLRNDTVRNVKLDRAGNSSYWWVILIVLAALGVVSYLAYSKYFKKKKETILQPVKIEKLIDYRKEALKLLEEAKRLFGEEKFKDAYGKAAEAIRLYYGHKLNAKKELTNSELISILKKNKIRYEKTQKCVNLCGLVEFAKYIANKKDFDEIVELGEEIIK